MSTKLKIDKIKLEKSNVPTDYYFNDQDALHDVFIGNIISTGTGTFQFEDLSLTFQTLKGKIENKQNVFVSYDNKIYTLSEKNDTQLVFIRYDFPSNKNMVSQFVITNLAITQTIKECNSGIKIISTTDTNCRASTILDYLNQGYQVILKDGNISYTLWKYYDNKENIQLSYCQFIESPIILQGKLQLKSIKVTETEIKEDNLIFSPFSAISEKKNNQTEEVGKLVNISSGQTKLYTAPIIKNLKDGSAAGSLRSIQSEGESEAYKLGDNSVSLGEGTIASGKNQVVIGKYNVSDTNNEFSYIIGNGIDNVNRSNVHTIDKNGNAWYQGAIKVGWEDNLKTVATTDQMPVEITFTDVIEAGNEPYKATSSKGFYEIQQLVGTNHVVYAKWTSAYGEEIIPLKGVYDGSYGAIFEKTYFSYITEQDSTTVKSFIIQVLPGTVAYIYNIEQDLSSYATVSQIPTQASDVGALSDKTTLADLTEDANHRLVTDTEKEVWNKKQDAGNYATVDQIPTQASDIGALSDKTTLANLTDDINHRLVTDAEKEKWNKKQDAGNYATVDQIPTVAADIGALPDTAGLKDLKPDENHQTVSFSKMAYWDRKADLSAIISNLKDGNAIGALETIGSINDKTSDKNYKMGENAFAQGGATFAKGKDSHAEGFYTNAGGFASHSEGWYTEAQGDYQHVSGVANILDSDGKYAEIVGNGMYLGGGSTGTFSNARTLDWYGNAWYKGGIKVGGSSQDDSLAKEVALRGDVVEYLNIGYIEGVNSEQLKSGAKQEIKIFITKNRNELITKDELKIKAWDSLNQPIWLFSKGFSENRQFIGIGSAEDKTDNRINFYVCKVIGNIETDQPVIAEYEMVSVSDLGKLKSITTEQIEPVGYNDGQLFTKRIASNIMDDGLGIRTLKAKDPNKDSILGDNAFAQGEQVYATGNNSFAQGKLTHAIGVNSHAEGGSTYAEGVESHAEGTETYATDWAHAEGIYTHAYGEGSHSEGYSFSTAIGAGSHSEGSLTKASGIFSHAEGKGDSKDEYYIVQEEEVLQGVKVTQNRLDVLNIKYDLTWNNGLPIKIITSSDRKPNFPSGYKIQLGAPTIVYYDLNETPNAETEWNKYYTAYKEQPWDITIVNGGAIGKGSHTEGLGTVAYEDYSHSSGKYNTIDEHGKYAEIVGNGENFDTRSNARTLDWNGNAWYKSGIKIGGDSFYSIEAQDVATVNQIPNSLSDLQSDTGHRTVSDIQIDSWNNKGDTLIRVGISPVDQPTGNGNYDQAIVLTKTGLEINNAINSNILVYLTGSVGKDGKNIVFQMFGNTDLSNKFICIEEESLHINQYIIEVSKANTNQAILKYTSYDISKAEGIQNIVDGRASGALRGVNSQVEGSDYAIGQNAVSYGLGTKATGNNQVVTGKYNAVDSNKAQIVGNGENNSSRSNIHTLDWNGTAWYKNGIKIGGTNQEDQDAKIVATVDQIPTSAESIGALSNKTTLADLTEDPSHRLVTDVEKEIWNGKQDAGNYATTDQIPTQASDIHALSDTTTLADLNDDATHRLVTDVEKETWNNKQDKGNYATVDQIPTSAIDLGALPNTTTLSDLADDKTHRLVTDTEKTTWNNKQNKLVKVNIGYGSNSGDSNQFNTTMSDGRGYFEGTISLGKTGKELYALKDQCYLEGSLGSGGSIVHLYWKGECLGGGVWEGVFTVDNALWNYAVEVSMNDSLKEGTLTAIRHEQEQSDWNQTSVYASTYIKNKPTTLADFKDDISHRLVTDAEKEKWNKKQDAGNYATVDQIPTSATDIGALPDNTTLANLAGDATHRLVTDTEKEKWNKKQDAGNYATVDQIPTTADSIGALPNTTILADLNDDATHRLVTDTEKEKWNSKQEAGNYATVDQIPTTLPASDVSAWAKSASKPEYSANEIKTGVFQGVVSGSVSSQPANQKVFRNIKLMTAAEYDTITDWGTILNEGEIVFRCEEIQG